MDNYSVHWFSDHNCEGCGLTFQDQTFLNKHKERKTCSESAKKAKNEFYEVQASEQEANQNKGYNCVYGGISCKGKFSSDVNFSLVILTTFEFSRQKVDTKLLENGAFESISNPK